MTADWIMYTVLAAIVALFLAAVFFADDIAAFLWLAALAARDSVVRAARLIASRYRPRLLRGAPADYAPLTPEQDEAWDEIEHSYEWRRGWRGHVIIVRKRGTWRRSPWTG